MKARAQSKWKPVKVSEPRKGRSRIFLNADLQKDVCFRSTKFSSVAQSCPTLCDPMDCSTPGFPVYHQLPELTQTHVHWEVMPSNHLILPFSSRSQSFPTSGSFQISQFFTSGGQRIGVSPSTSVLPMNIKDSFPLGWTGWISLQSKGLSRGFSSTTVQKHQFFGTQLPL